MNANTNKSVILSASLLKLTTDTCRSDMQVRNKWVFLAKSYHDEGIASLMLNKPERGEKSPYEKLHRQVETAIVMSFDGEIQDLMKKEPKTLSKIDQGTRRYWQQQVGRYFAGIRSHIANFEKAEQDEAESKTRQTKSKKTRILEGMAQVVKIAKGYESADFDIKSFLSKMQEAELIVKNKS